ncbi:MAG: signal recognition particle-docking protein FtsY [Treponema sp.]|nr:signal recognition particle-docking protein FtsY [Treponema sp.]
MGKASFAERIQALFRIHRATEDDFYDDLTDALIEGDVGTKDAFLIVDALKKECGRHASEELIAHALERLLLADVQGYALTVTPGKTNVWMVLGVNGVGKTTTVAKLAYRYCAQGVSPVVLAAADTFRAAAIEQLGEHARRIGIRMVSHQHGSDPSAVVYDAADAVRAQGGGLVIVDTAGRLHTKDNLVRELEKIDRICEQKADERCYRRILVIDATTGQNAFRQAETFTAAVPLDALIVTKCESTARGGIIVSIGRELHIPVAFLGTGERYEQMEPFSTERYVKNFLGTAL